MSWQHKALSASIYFGTAIVFGRFLGFLHGMDNWTDRYVAAAILSVLFLLNAFFLSLGGRKSAYIFGITDTCVACPLLHLFEFQGS